jgi:hypothetical protein
LRATPFFTDVIFWLCIDALIRSDLSLRTTTAANQVPRLIRRIRNLWRVYYNHRVTSRLNAEDRATMLTFCDFSTVYDVSSRLYKIALYLQLDPPRLETLMKSGKQDVENLLLVEDLDYGPYRRHFAKMNKLASKDDETDDNDRERLGEMEDLAMKDLAAYVMTWFFGTLNVAFVVIASDPSYADKSSLPWTKWRELAVNRLVKWTTNVLWRDVLGDPMTDAMRLIYWDKRALVEYAHAGGLAALFGDWVYQISIPLKPR